MASHRSQAKLLNCSSAVTIGATNADLVFSHCYTGNISYCIFKVAEIPLRKFFAWNNFGAYRQSDFFCSYFPAVTRTSSVSITDSIKVTSITIDLFSITIFSFLSFSYPIAENSIIYVPDGRLAIS